MQTKIDQINKATSGITIEHEWVAISIALISIIAAFIMALKQINNSRDIAKKTKAIEILIANDKKKIHEDGMKVLRRYKVNGKEKLIARLAENKLFKIKISKLKRKIRHLCSCLDESKEQENMIKDKIKIARKKQRIRVSDRESLLELLNYYEYIAIAIRKDIICDDLMFNANHSSFVWIYKLSKPFIDALQNDQKTVFSEITVLNKKWIKRRLEIGLS